MKDRRRRSQPFTLPAPIGGLNGRDGLAAMDKLDAYLLDNWFPSTTSVDSRAGHEEHAIGLVDPVETLAVFTSATDSVMLGFAGGDVYDVTDPGTVGAALATGRSGNKISSTMFSNVGDAYLWGCNGVDNPFVYDGTTFDDTITLTGITGSQDTLVFVHSYGRRLLLAQTGMLGFYYLGVGAIQGAASYFDLAEQCLKGGYLMAMATVTQDAGLGPQNYILFVTSEGEYLLYAGFDPSDAANFQLVGRYVAAPPIGRNCIINYGPDQYIVTEDGVLSFSEIKASAEAGSELSAITSKLGEFLQPQLNRYLATYGWQGLLYPRGGMLVFNVPSSTSIAGAFQQYAMNTTTNAWSRFTGQNGIFWVVFNRRLYFGTYDGRVMLADEGSQDDGEQIQLDCKQAYFDFEDGRGVGQMQKHFHFATFIMQTDGELPLAAELSVDYVDSSPVYVATPANPEGSIWDVADWDVSDWSPDGVTEAFRADLGVQGFVASIWLRAVCQGTSLKWWATRYVFQRTEALL